MNELDKLLVNEQNEARQALMAEGKLEDAWVKLREHINAVTLEVYDHRWRLAEIKRRIAEIKGGRS